MLLKNQWITKEIKEEIKNYPETNANKNATIRNLWDAGKAGIRGKSIAIQSYIKKQEKMLEPTKKDTLYPKTKKKPPKDGRRSTITIKSNPIPTR